MQVAAALGNQKPEVLRMFEDQIWLVLRDVVLRNVGWDRAVAEGPELVAGSDDAQGMR